MNANKKNAVTQHTIVFFLIAFIILLIYGNTFDAAWHFDDNTFILNNPRIQIQNLSRNSIFNALYSESSQGTNINRPIGRLTFALNWYFGQDHVFGYHLINIIIHILTTYTLFHILVRLLKTSDKEKRGPKEASSIALLGALLWALNPLQIQAITYISQRFAALAALFYAIGIFFYICGRMSVNASKKYMFLGGCLCFSLLAIGTKENAVMLPLALLLIEVIFFNQSHHLLKNKAIKTILIALPIIILTAVLLSGFEQVITKICEGYDDRAFTLTERLLTEPRVVLFYICQLFYPVPGRLSLEHDIRLSTSLFHPWTTLPAIAIILVLFIFGLLRLKKNPFLSLGILFFFLHHIVESTVIPTELIFEHRNYLPSLFLFMPVAIALKQLLDHFQTKPVAYFTIATSIGIWLMVLGISTYTRNLTWNTEKSLWEDAARKAPQAARPLMNLAQAYYEKIGQMNKALALYQKALTLNYQRPRLFKAQTLINMAAIYSNNYMDDQALEACQKAFLISPENDNILYRLILVLIRKGNLDEASEKADMLIQRQANASYLAVKAQILLLRDNPRAALIYLRESYRLKPNDVITQLKIGIALTLIGNHPQAELFLRNGLIQAPDDLSLYLWLIENNLLAGNDQKAEHYIHQLLSRFSWAKIEADINELANDRLLPPLPEKRVFQSICKWASATGKQPSTTTALQKH